MCECEPTKTLLTFNSCLKTKFYPLMKKGKKEEIITETGMKYSSQRLTVSTNNKTVSVSEIQPFANFCERKKPEIKMFHSADFTVF